MNCYLIIHVYDMQWHYFTVLLQETIIKFYEQDSEADIILSKIYISKHIRGLLPLTKMEEQGLDLSFHKGSRKKKPNKQTRKISGGKGFSWQWILRKWSLGDGKQRRWTYDCLIFLPKGNTLAQIYEGNFTVVQFFLHKILPCAIG